MFYRSFRSPRSLQACIAKAAVAITLLFAPAGAYAVEEMFVNPSSTTPADGQEIPSSVGVDNIYITIPGGGDIGIESFNERGATVTILKDGQPFESLSSANPNEISFNPKDANGIILRTGVLTEPGTYSVTLPQKLVKMAVDTFGFTPGGDENTPPPTYYNKEYTFSFTIVEMPEFSITPRPGLYQPSEIVEFRISFPEGAIVICNNTASGAAFYGIDTYKSYSGDLLTTYSCRADGNQLVLTANNPANIKGLEGSVNRSWDYLQVAKNAVTIILNGKEYNNPPLVFEKYDIRTIGAEGFTISPSLADNMLPEDLKVFKVGYPADVTFDRLGEVGSVAAFLKQTGVGEESRLKYSGMNFGEFVITDIDQVNHVLTLTMKDPESEIAYYNNPANMETAYYCLSFSSRVFYKVSTLNFPGYGVTGKDGCMVTGLKLLSNSGEYDSLTIEKGQTFSAVELYTDPFNVKRATGSNLITLTLNGTEVWSNKVSAYFTTSYDNYFKINFNKSFSEPGDYVLKIPAGSFMQKGYGDYRNLAQELHITILDPTGVEDVAVEDPDIDTQVEYYTLTGLRVAPGALIPNNIYLRRQGTRTTKFIATR